ncbi:NXPE family member 3-like [Pungitius pungitius]|uniref:NXPE family member 3-like n=1 Tax=Pungitius pungitius TaxID=134920 RepID=UPI002E134595
MTMKTTFCVRRLNPAIFLFLAVIALIFVLYHMDILQFQPELNSSIIMPRVSPHHIVNHRFCTFQPRSPQDALEERLILDSIAWPETPLLPSPVSLEQTTDPAHSTFTILPGRKGGQWHVGDQLEVMIQTFDFKGRPKKSGGDFLTARLHNLKLEAGVAGQVVDHLNGSYSAVFSLLWEGDARVEVTLVHPGEAVTVLNRLNREQPDRSYFKSLYRSGSLSETTICNVCLRPTQQPVCNHTDLRTGEPWFCYKPKSLSCDTRINHFKLAFKHNLPAEEEKLFQSGVNLKVSIQATGPSDVTVLPEEDGQLKVKSSSVTSLPSGYYYQGVWRALGGTTVSQFNTSAITKCLKGKAVHMYGDSTVRQWFEFLNAVLPGLKEFDLHNPRYVGPFMSLDNGNNILVRYRCHGPPLHWTTIPRAELRYIANELDDLNAGPNNIVVLSIWAHFGTFPMEIYIRRLQSIRRAVVQLLDTNPGTLVIIRTANPRALSLQVSLTNSDWYSLQCDKVLKAMFKGLKVHLIDAWEMTLAHHLPHNIHPPPPIIKNMINCLLSYICPQKHG